MQHSKQGYLNNQDFYGEVRMPSKRVFGIAVNDSAEPVSKVFKGRQVFCIFYQTWKDMLRRCYDKKYQESKPTYIGCEVCHEWLKFSNFKNWMEKQDWQGKQLDKDLIVTGNKIYSPEFCVFLSPDVNSFVSGSAELKAGKLMGSSKDKKRNTYNARCGNPITGRTESLGCYADEISAHNAWKARKNQIANLLADLQHDVRVSGALRLRYA